MYWFYHYFQFFLGEMMKLHVMSIRDIKVLAENPKMLFKSQIVG